MLSDERLDAERILEVDRQAQIAILERHHPADRGGSDARGGGVARGEPGKLVSPQRRRQAVVMLEDRLVLGAVGVPVCRTASLDPAA
ncbi:MAG: hypothetical protein JO168_17035 [Solirubrobacterales bacterium]|nr:hypothetical protein [Solirubrobacterales bacterium]